MTFRRKRSLPIQWSFGIIAIAAAFLRLSFLSGDGMIVVGATEAGCVEGQEAAVHIGQIPEELAYEARWADGLPERMDLGYSLESALPSGSQAFIDCQELHWGLSGNATLTCSDGLLSINSVDCLRTRCPWHNYMARTDIGNYTDVDGDTEVAASNLGPARWSDATLAPNGIVYVVPLASSGVLRIDASAGIAEVISGPDLEGGLAGLAKYNAAVLASSGLIVGIPFSAQKVLLLNPATDEIMLFGDVGSGRFKWSHGVESASGQIFCIPAAATDILRIDPVALSAVTLGMDLSGYGEGLQKWVHAVVAPDGMIFAIPGDAQAVLRIDPITEEVLAVGSLGVEGFKWSHGLVAADGRIYGVPASALAVLVIDPTVEPPSVDGATLGAGMLPSGERKWQHGVEAADRRIYCVPRSASQVLRIDPAEGVVALFGAVGSGTSKWRRGALGLDGAVYAAPADSLQVLKIDPWSGEVSQFGALRDGEQKFGDAVVVPGGDIVMVPSFATRALKLALPSNACLGAPIGQDVACALGELCEVRLAPAAGRPSALDDGGTLWVTEANTSCLDGGAKVSMPGLFNPQPTSNESRISNTGSDGGGIVRSYDFGSPMLGEPGAFYSLCWTPPSPPYSAADIVRIGGFDVQGPRQGVKAQCTLGVECVLVLDGFGISNGSWVAILPVGSVACGSPAVDGAVVNDLGTIADPGAAAGPVPGGPLDSGGGESARYEIGVPRRGVVGDGYRLCWADAAVQAAEGQDWPPPISVQVEIGTFELFGPSLPMYSDIGSNANSTVPFLLQCWSGFPCGFSIAGAGLSIDNRISIEPSPCGSLAAAPSDGLVPRGVAAVSPPESAGSATATYSFGMPEQGQAANLSLCWRATAPGAEPASVPIEYGSLEVYGPVGGGVDLTCVLNSACAFELDPDIFVASGMMGSGLAATNRVAIVPGACSADIELSPAWQGALSAFAPVESDAFAEEAPAPAVVAAAAARYELGTPLAEDLATTGAVVGSYRLCWSPNGRPDSFLMDLGALTILDSPCAVPEVAAGDGGASPPCLSTETGDSVFALRHGETCTPRCHGDFTPSETELGCGYGELSPPSFECFARCLVAPTVTNGLNHANCAGLAHGEVCALQCPDGTLKSGDLICSRGRFVHVQNPSIQEDHLLFDVPRCYSACGTSTSCAEGSPSLEHGERCRPRCPAGSAPTDVAELQCIDGSVLPPSFTCASGCPEPPDIRGAGDLSHCAGAPHGSRCGLRCQAGHIRSPDDPVCQNGAWTSAQCFAPCIVPEVGNVSSPPCRSGLNPWGSVSHGLVCEPMCLDGFTPEIEIANSNDGADDDALGLGCDDGVLSGTFLCRSGCSQLPFVEYADEVGLVDCRGMMHNATCATPCLGGYQKSEDLVCFDGGWNDAAVECIPECSNAPSVLNAFPAASCVKRTNGEECEVECLPGFVASGVSMCEDGIWSPVTCLAQCLAPAGIKFIASGSSCAEGASVLSGGVCTPNCAQGFEPSVARALACEDGMLDPPTFRCLRTCGDAPSIRNAADLSRCNDVNAGDICALECKAGFLATGSLFCGVAGEWHAAHRVSLLGNSGAELGSGRLLGTLNMASGFDLSFDLELHTAAGAAYQGIIHVTQSGNDCCRLGDRMPMVLVSNPFSETSRSFLHVFIDPDGKALCQEEDNLPSIRVGDRTSVFIRLTPTFASVTIDDMEVCTQPRTVSVPAADGVKVYAAPEWIQKADALIASVVYEETGLESTMPSCERVECGASPPAVRGSHEARSEVVSESLQDPPKCEDRSFGAVCVDPSWCPDGMKLEGRFVCSGDGSWKPEDGQEVHCRSTVCPEQPPALIGAVDNATCLDRNVGDRCVATCIIGYQSVGGYICGEDERWSAVPDSPPTCLPMACGDTPPRVPNGVLSDDCGGLPSGATCEGSCRRGWSALGSFRCEAGIWVEAPICLEDQEPDPDDPGAGAGGGAVVAAVVAAVALRPSSELMQRYPSALDWLQFSLLQWFFPQALSPLLGGADVHVLALAEGGSGADSGGRRLQTEIRTPTWTVNVIFAALPLDPLAAASIAASADVADASGIASRLISLDMAMFSRTLIAELPLTVSPAMMSVDMASPRLVNWPGEVPAFLATEAFKSAGPVPPEPTTTTTTTLRQTAASTTSAPAADDGGAAAAEDEGGGRLIAGIITGSMAPCAFCIGLLVFYRWAKKKSIRKAPLDRADRADYNYAQQTQNAQFDYEGINALGLQKWLIEQDGMRRREEMKYNLGLNGAAMAAEAAEAAARQRATRRPASSAGSDAPKPRISKVEAGAAMGLRIPDHEQSRASVHEKVVDLRVRRPFCESVIRWLCCGRFPRWCRRCCCCRQRPKRQHSSRPRAPSTSTSTSTVGGASAAALPKLADAASGAPLALPPSAAARKGDDDEPGEEPPPEGFASLEVRPGAAGTGGEGSQSPRSGAAKAAAAGASPRSLRIARAAERPPSKAVRVREAAIAAASSAEEDAEVAEEREEGDAPLTLRHDREDLPQRDDVQADGEDIEAEDDEGGDEAGHTKFREFFEFPEAGELLAPWEEKLPYYWPRPEEEEDNLTEGHSSKKTMPSSTREDDGGSIVKFAKGRVDSEKFNTHIKSWKFSPPMRRGIREREDDIKAERRQLHASLGGAVGTSSVGGGAAKGGSDDGYDAGGATEAADDDARPKLEPQEPGGVRFSFAPEDRAVHGQQRPEPSAPPKPKMADRASDGRDGEDFDNEGENHDDAALRRKFRASQGRTDTEDDAYIIRRDPNASSGEEDDMEGAAWGTLNLPQEDGSQPSALAMPANAQAMSSAHMTASQFGTSFLSSTNFVDEGNQPPPSPELIAEAVRRARETPLYKQRAEQAATKHSAETARAKAAQRAEAVAKRAALARQPEGGGWNPGDWVPDPEAMVQMVERATGVEIGGGTSMCGTSRSACGT